MKNENFRAKSYFDRRFWVLRLLVTGLLVRPYEYILLCTYYIQKSPCTRGVRIIYATERVCGVICYRGCVALNKLRRDGTHNSRAPFSSSAFTYVHWTLGVRCVWSNCYFYWNFSGDIIDSGRFCVLSFSGGFHLFPGLSNSPSISLPTKWYPRNSLRFFFLYVRLSKLTIPVFFFE